jgi:DNA-binding MarR family transcriptional regulator
MAALAKQGIRAQKAMPPALSATRPMRVRARSPRSDATLEARLLATVGPLMRYVFAHARRNQTWSELTYQQYSFLRVLDVYGPSAPATISRHLMVAAPSITRTSGALTDAGLIERSRDPNDGRAVLLQLTNLGRRRVRAMRRELLRVIRELLDPLPEERRAALGTAFDELSRLLETSVWQASSKDGLESMR